MSTYIWILLIVVIIMALYLLFYTYSVAKTQKVKERYDSSIDESVKEHPYLRNPVFVSLFIGTILIAGFIFYYAFQ
ncbi:hypothetical protein ACWF7H_05335 [Peribacillus butanolivorans]|uniref:Short-chain dehydrogenase n=1 Tax=Peribacillus butanolivorans TaxID=421767 RepID=A0AAX0S7E6_9BACI|nr:MULTISPECIES: hypothetical protein [Peribacillus]MBK5445718.1 hypothetical protein [Peribacillus sp. TH24]MBK5459566.1 hypothetical protein [Peribacillus sp. TH27]MBK5481375.1 hypothetical protein [Peribacillus sp. TH16]MBK5497756.1 hypothetical protein [Peribacillus sp. TH14]PEJ35254.1 hypothetical protein CN689_08035 [Peribacillus butanolivorans]